MTCTKTQNGEEVRRLMREAMPGTILELAKAAGVQRGSAKYHIDRMTAYHQVVELGTRPTSSGGARVKVYGLPGMPPVQPRKLEVNSPWRTVWVGGPPYGAKA